MSNSLDSFASPGSRPSPTFTRMPTDINVNEPVEIDYWVERLGVSEHSLRQAVADVGVSAQEVAEHLGKRVIAPGSARA